MIGELGYTRGCCSRNVLRASAISHQLFLIFPRTDAGKIVSPAVLNASREGLMKKTRALFRHRNTSDFDARRGPCTIVEMSLRDQSLARWFTTG